MWLLIHNLSFADTAGNPAEAAVWDVVFPPPSIRVPSCQGCCRQHHSIIQYFFKGFCHISSMQLLWLTVENIICLFCADIPSLGDRLHHLLGAVEEPGLGPHGGRHCLLHHAGQLQPVLDGDGLRDADPGGPGRDPPLLGRHHRRDLLREHRAGHGALCGLLCAYCSCFLCG